MEILENAGLIKIDRNIFVISGEEKEKIVVTTVVEASKKGVYLIGDGLNHVRLRSLVNVIKNYCIPLKMIMK